MLDLAVVTWDVDPAIFELFGREIRWYGLLFALGLLFLGPAVEARIWKKEKLNPELMDSLFVYVVLGTVIGARLGHVLFYDPVYYFSHPLEILAIWHGGLASHGGTIGVIFGAWLFSKKVAKQPLLWTLDRLAVPVGLAAMFIRLGNLMNSEIFGRPTDQPWGFRFLRSPEYIALVPDKILGCHPTQIYEALAYFGVFLGCMWLYWKRDAAQRYEGLIVGFFLFGIFFSRFLIESIKNVQEAWELSMQDMIGINQGQLLSLPFILIGASLMYQAFRKTKRN